jgi:hypothetical protein
MSSNPIVMAALLYCRLGLAVHWLRPHGKEPVSYGYQRASCANPMQLLATYRRGYNVGLHTGRVQGCRNPVVVLDLDTEEALSWARAKLPLSPVRARSRKGEHWYYRRPEGGERIGNRVRVDGIALDIRADEGNIVAPPSIHPTGFVYEAIEPWTAERVRAMPHFERDWFPPPPVAPVPRLPAWQPPEAAQQAAKRAAAYLQKVPPAIAGQGGSLQTFNAAVALVRGLAVDEETAYRLLAEHYNPRCEPPWSEAELRHKVLYAARALRVPLGSLLTPAAESSPRPALAGLVRGGCSS